MAVAVPHYVAVVGVDIDNQDILPGAELLAVGTSPAVGADIVVADKANDIRDTLDLGAVAVVRNRKVLADTDAEGDNSAADTFRNCIAAAEDIPSCRMEAVADK